MRQVQAAGHLEDIVNMESFATSSIESLSDNQVLRTRDTVLEQIGWARRYTLQLLETVPQEQWYVTPREHTSNIAWQVGHLAVSQYGLMLFRQFGRQPGDLELMPGWLRKKFGRGTTPATTSDGMPTPEELLESLERIHQAASAKAEQLTAEILRESTDMPYTAYPNKLGAYLFCPIHESLHAGQIGMLRRGLGLDPVR